MPEKKAVKPINIEIVETTEPVVESIVEPVVEPAVEPVVEPVVEPAVEPAVETAAAIVDPVSGLSVAEKIAYYRANMNSNAEAQIAEIRERI